MNEQRIVSRLCNCILYIMCQTCVWICLRRSELFATNGNLRLVHKFVKNDCIHNFLKFDLNFAVPGLSIQFHLIDIFLIRFK